MKFTIYDLRFTMLLFAYCLLRIANCFAQDPHFTQYNHTPMLLNPGMLAAKSEMQFIFNYRSQWASIIKPYSSPMATVIYPFISKNENKKRWGGAGLSFISDRAGEFGYLQTIGISGGFAYNLNLPNENYLSSGVQLGYFQKHILTNKFASGNQWDNGAYNPNKALGENFQSESVGMEDVSAGIFWYKTDEEKINYYSGISLFHLTQPDESFTKTKSNLPMRFIYYGGLKAFTIGDNIDVVPSVLYMNQRKAQEINIGSYFRYNFSEFSSKIVQGGSIALATWFRTKDAVNLGLEIAHPNFVFGLSYDINVSSLNDATKSKGSFEIAFVLKKTIGGEPKTRYNLSLVRVQKEPEPILISLLVNVNDDETKQGLPSEIILKNRITGEIIQTETDSVMIATLSPRINYELTVQKTGYQFYKEEFNIMGEITASKEFKKKVELKKEKTPQIKVSGFLIDLELKDAVFDLNKIIIKEEVKPNLDKLAEYLQENPSIKLEIAGHTDNSASDDFNMVLSQKRANAIADYLVNKGIAQNRLSAKGYGKKKPIASNDTEKGRAKNRRVEFIILEK